MIYTEKWILSALEEMTEANAAALAMRRWRELPAPVRELAHFWPLRSKLDRMVAAGKLEKGWGIAPTAGQFVARRGLRAYYYWLPQPPVYPDGAL